jgi:hypothetical protein
MDFIQNSYKNLIKTAYGLVAVTWSQMDRRMLSPFKAFWLFLLLRKYRINMKHNGTQTHRS